MSKNKRTVTDTNNPLKANSADLSLEPEIRGGNKLFILSVIFVLIMALNIPTYHSFDKYADSFHEGESLGTAMSYMAGKVPYKETIFMHGIFQDPLRSVLAFKLFGKSIGSARTLESILKISSFVLLFILLLKLFQQNYLYAYITFLILIFFCHSSVSKFSYPTSNTAKRCNHFSFYYFIPIVKTVHYG